MDNRLLSIPGRGLKAKETDTWIARSGRARRSGLALVLASALTAICPALWGTTTVNLNPSKDNTLYEYDPNLGDLSNALGDHFFAGKTGQGTGSLRRGVLAFDIAGSIPSGSTITSASLTMNMSRTVSLERMVELHKLLADGGEGPPHATGEEGQGAPATTNDATWRHRFYNNMFWTMQGGDFSATVSASQSVSGIGQYVWSSAQMVADVQLWLNNPA